MGVSMRSFAAAALCLLLVLTSQSMAVARGASAATGQMVLCIGSTTQTVYVDAEGQPTTAPHLCPDCILVLSTTDDFYAGETKQQNNRDARARLHRAAPILAFRDRGFQARGPPRVV